VSELCKNICSNFLKNSLGKGRLDRRVLWHPHWRFSWTG